MTKRQRRGSGRSAHEAGPHRADARRGERVAPPLIVRDLALSGGDPIHAEIATWLTESRRFRDFAIANRDKIRRKLRGAISADAQRDLRTELRIASLLTAERRVELAFEAYGSGRQGPDFTVTIGSARFNVEVTRRHRPAASAAHPGTLLAKLRQLRPSVANVLLVAIPDPDAAAFDVASVVGKLRARADAKEESYFTARGVPGTRAFYERFLRLGAVLVWAETGRGESRAAVWTNRSARIAVPDRALRLCLGCLRAG